MEFMSNSYKGFRQPVIVISTHKVSLKSAKSKPDEEKECEMETLQTHIFGLLVATRLEY